MDLGSAMIGDLHIHSRFSRACSKDLTFENLVKWAKIKGLGLLGTGDFTHPIWFEEIKRLKPNGKGLYYCDNFPFVITGEVSLVYTQGKGRRIHLIVLVPSIEIAEKINSYLDGVGRRDYDGRPIFKLSGEKFVRDLMEISKAIEIIPAHAWTPWFGVFGSMSGFDSLKECFGEQIKNIHAIETGLSSDPEMNWRIRELENKSIVSFSDSHSFWPWRLGREATIFKKTDSYFELVEQIRKNNFVGTIEVEPAYGKYHWDGHRLCNFVCSPEKTSELRGICPECKSPLTIGVENRVEFLAENPKGHKSKNAKEFFKVLPLHEIIGLFLKLKPESVKTWTMYNLFLKEFENEFKILLEASKEEMLRKGFDAKLIDLILKNREGKIKVKPGYDGIYGEAVLEEEQKKLF
jgi:uncharacterized protein (TIGR00375 family)